jgi:hypothetical protein
MLFALFLPKFFDGAVVGASAGACGLIAAFAVINWTERFMLLIYFIPVAMRGKTLLWFMIALTVAGILFPHSFLAILLGSNVANAAHLGGILTGFFFTRWIFQGNWPRLNFSSRRSPPAESDVDFSTDEFVKTEVDPILEKISAHGIHSLTAREREILQKARSRMVKR